MAKKKKTEKIGIIKGTDILKQTRPPQERPFCTGYYQTEKDRPRKKNWKKDLDI